MRPALDAAHAAAVIVSFALIGGFIGYITNVLAIRLIFRPKKRYCLLPGGRLCIQGLLPARKRELAKRLGAVAAEYALSESVQERYRERLERELAATIRELIESRVSGGGLPSPLSVVAPGLAEMVARAASPAIMRLVREASSRINVAEIVEEEFMNMSVDDLEKVFRDIAGRELRFIEVMGFVLGAVIGAVEGAVALLV